MLHTAPLDARLNFDVIRQYDDMPTPAPQRYYSAHLDCATIKY